MPAGLAFLNVKSWHPATYENQKRIWIAEQKAKEKEKREKEAAAQLLKETEAIRYEEMAKTRGASLSMLATDQERHEQGKTALNFLYAKPPGMAEAEAAAAAAAAAGDDEAVKEFYRKAAKKKKDNEDFSMHAKLSALEKMTGKKRRTDDLTIEEQVERFPFLKDAPLEGGYVKDVKVTLKPFNQVVRNTRCLRCGEWGHQTGDRECTMRDFNPHDAARQQREDPLTYMQTTLPQEKQRIALKLAALPREMAGAGRGGRAAHDEVVLEEDEGLLPGALAGLGDEGGAYDEVDEAFLATLSTKEKKLLLKRLKEQAAGGGVGEGEGEEGKGRKRRKREKDKKRSKKDKKKKEKRKHKSSSSSGGGGGGGSSSDRRRKRRKRSASMESSSSSGSASEGGSGKT